MENIAKKISEILDLLEHSEPEMPLSLIKEVESESRKDFGVHSIEFFSKPCFVQQLINIGNKYTKNETVLEQVVRIMKTISERCSVDSQKNQRVSTVFEVKTQALYNFLFSQKDSKNKKIKTLIAYTIPFFPQFDDYEQRWEYILSIPKITPKKQSQLVFRWIIEKNIHVIPNGLKDTIIRVFQDFIEKEDLESIDITTHKIYVNLIKNLEVKN